MFLSLKPGLFALLLHKILARDFKLFLFRVTLQAKHFHAVLKSRRNGVHHVRRSHKQHLREVVVDVEVVILEGRVLLGVKDFKQRGSGIAAEIRGHLVDFVEQENRVLGARAFHVLDDLTRQSADICPAMAANLRFVAHPAERETDKLPACGLGDRHAQRGLAHTRRSREA